jgi:hypothetical protein
MGNILLNLIDIYNTNRNYILKYNHNDFSVNQININFKTKFIEIDSNYLAILSNNNIIVWDINNEFDFIFNINLFDFKDNFDFNFFFNK